MTKKYGKDTFRRSKKKILHKKGVNTKKRGLRGGMFKLFNRSPTSSPVAKPRSHIDPDGTLHGIRDKITLSKLSDAECLGYMDEISQHEATGKRINLVKGSGGIRDYNECLSMLNLSVTFDTTLVANQIPSQRSEPTLTLRGCKAIKKGITGTSDNFKYEIYSPAATTETPNGGAQQETLVGTFTQLPVGTILKMAGKETPFSFASFYNSDTTRESYFKDYLSCLENVKKKFGIKNDPEKGISQKETFRNAESSILRNFGKTPQCKIVLVAGNVGTEIQKPENNGARFLLPSQLNGAEYPSPKPVTDLNSYKYDPTGGPLGQLSCHPVVAKFILEHAARKIPTTGNDFTSNFLVINAVDDVIDGINNNMDSKSLTGMKLNLNNGYLEVSPDLVSSNFELTNMAAISEIFNKFSSKLKVLQTDDVPTNGLTPPNIYTKFNSESTSKVSLIYASAVPLNYQSAINPEKSTLQYCVAGFDLVAQYFGAMVSAYYRKQQLLESTALAAAAAAAAGAPDADQRQKEHQELFNPTKLFLTPLGGGVFKNPREMIASSVLLAYYQAQQLFSDFDANVQVIFLVWDGSEDECSDFSEFFNEDDTQSVTQAIRNLQQKKEKERQRQEQFQREAQAEKLGESSTLGETGTAAATAAAAGEEAEEREASGAVPGDNMEGRSETSVTQQLPVQVAQPSPATITGEQLFQQYGLENLSDFTNNGKIVIEGDLNSVFIQNTQQQNKIIIGYIERVLLRFSDKDKDNKKLNVLLDKDNFEGNLKNLFTILEITYDSDNILNLKKIVFLQRLFDRFMTKFLSNHKYLANIGYINLLLEKYGFFIKKTINSAAPASETSGAAGVADTSSRGYNPNTDEHLLSLGGGSKSRRRHRHKPARKTTRKYKSKSKSKPKTHRRRRAHKKYTRKR
jgi:hypothetical protein